MYNTNHQFIKSLFVFDIFLQIKEKICKKGLQIFKLVKFIKLKKVLET